MRISTTMTRILFLLFVLITLQGAAAFNCTNSVEDCDARGVCVSNACRCDDNYVTHPADHYPACNYKQLARTGPFVCHLFVGSFTGCGAWMASNDEWGLASLLTFWVPVVFICCIACAIITMEDRADAGTCVTMCGYCFAVLWLLAVVALWVALLVLIGSGALKDGHGVSLGDW